jgi:argininosuccinate lyase
MKSLPLAYNRDMQEDKGPLFDAVDTLKACVEIYIKMLPNIEIKKEAMLEAASRGFLNATDMADYLVARGMPFRQAHSCIGKIVSYAINENKELHEMTLKELKPFSSLFKQDVFDILTTRQMIDRRKSSGGTATKNVKAAIKQAEVGLKKESENLMG